MVITANARDATHVLDGLPYHESDLRIEEHYTDTAGFTDHVLRSVICWASASRPASATSLTSGSMFRARSATMQRSLC
jgi:TnpA family transposase